MTTRFDTRLRVRALIVLALLSILCNPVSARENRICEYCREPITDNAWIEAEGKFYHSDHFRCDHCDEIIRGSYTRHDGGIYHITCYNEHYALRCSLCGGVIEGRYQQDFWGNSYHEFHDGEADRCQYCGRFISRDLTDGGVKYRDGRIICGLCGVSAVAEADDVAGILAEVASSLAGYGIKTDADDIPVVLVDRHQMAEQRDTDDTRTRGFAKHTRRVTSDGRVTAEYFRIYALHGMPRRALVSTLAHELMHVWLSRHGAENMDRVLTEGSCNYASYLILQQDDSEEARYMIWCLSENDDSVYNEGFRRVSEYVGGAGIAGWLKYLRANAEPPWKNR